MPSGMPIVISCSLWIDHDGGRRKDVGRRRTLDSRRGDGADRPDRARAGQPRRGRRVLWHRSRAVPHRRPVRFLPDPPQRRTLTARAATGRTKSPAPLLCDRSGSASPRRPFDGWQTSRVRVAGISGEARTRPEEGAVMLKALVLRKQDAAVAAAVEDRAESQRPEGDVTVEVEYSTLSDKDGLIIRNKAPLVRNYPHVPGIDLAGRVVESAHPDWRPGDAVVLTGWGVGERHWGGHAQRARVKGDWLVPLPAGWRTEHAMAVGTAGFTAMLAVLALESHGLQPGAGEVLV